MGDAIAILKEHEKRLLAYIAQRSRDPADADDFLQETMLRVLEQSRKQEIANPMAYAYRVADTVIYAQSRRYQREAELLDEEYECDAPLADEQLAYTQRVAVMREALNTLSPLQRKVFVMRRIDGLSRTRIADELGLSIEAVKKHLVRAMATMTEKVAGARDEVSKHNIGAEQK